MRKILSIIILSIIIGIEIKAQVLSVSDTIHELSFFCISQVSGDTIHRSSARYSPMDEDVNQNFRDLRIEKVKVENNIFYVLTFQKTSVVSYDAKSYVTLAIEFGRKNTSQHDVLNDSYYFALTESQYNEIRNIIAEGKGKIKKIKSDIQGEPYVGPNSIKHCLKSRYKVEHTFAISAFGNEIKFRLPETYYGMRLTKKLFNNNHFTCNREVFEKLFNNLQ